MNNQNTIEYHDDDRPIGRLLSRREVLTLFGGAGAAALLSACAPFGFGRPPGPPPGEGGGPDLAAIETVNASLPEGCVVRPELTEGPVFVEEDLNRIDIRTDPSNSAVSEGVQLDLTFNITELTDGACTPLAGVQVDVWHCNANGIYSDTTELGMQTVGQKFLRGYQITDQNGMARFTTIYPGWYEGRTVHIHFKMRTKSGYDFTSQLFFDDKLTDEVFAQAPYNSRGERNLRNDEDGIFGQSGNQMMLTLKQVETGYETNFNVALDLS